MAAKGLDSSHKAQIASTVLGDLVATCRGIISCTAQPSRAGESNSLCLSYAAKSAARGICAGWTAPVPGCWSLVSKVMIGVIKWCSNRNMVAEGRDVWNRGVVEGR